MNAVALFFETNQGKYIKNFVIGIGASVVLLGALFKIQHWPGASEMLIAGMCTEALIFAMLGLLPPNKDYYWERYYPDITDSPLVEAYQKGQKTVTAKVQGESLIQSLDKMLEEAQINTPNLKKLGDSFQNFSKTVTQMKEVGDMTAATNLYTQNARDAAVALGEMKDTFRYATYSMATFNNAVEDTTKFQTQLAKLSVNLDALNQVYEVELSDANNHMKAMNRFYSSLVNATENMAANNDDATAAKTQLAALSANLASLNEVYKGMLQAMKG